MNCLERRVDNLERRRGDRRGKKRYFTIEKIILLLLVTAGVGAAHMLGWRAQQDISTMKDELTTISKMQQELHIRNARLYNEKVNPCVEDQNKPGSYLEKCGYDSWGTYMINPKMQP